MDEQRYVTVESFEEMATQLRKLQKYVAKQREKLKNYDLMLTGMSEKVRSLEKWKQHVQAAGLAPQSNGKALSISEITKENTRLNAPKSPSKVRFEADLADDGTARGNNRKTTNSTSVMINNNNSNRFQVPTKKSQDALDRTYAANDPRNPKKRKVTVDNLESLTENDREIAETLQKRLAKPPKRNAQVKALPPPPPPSSTSPKKKIATSTARKSAPIKRIEEDAVPAAVSGKITMANLKIGMLVKIHSGNPKEPWLGEVVTFDPKAKKAKKECIGVRWVEKRAGGTFAYAKGNGNNIFEDNILECGFQLWKGIEDRWIDGDRPRGKK